ncbi:hypothetical protein Tco_1569030 [Tanacetum coccineum]
MYYPQFTKVIIHHFLIQEKTLSWRNKIGMHTSKDDYLINTLRFVSRKEASQIYGDVLPECLTSPEMKESKAYKTYLGYATGDVPPKIARKFKKASPTKKDIDLVPVYEEPVIKGKRIKRSVKKSSTKPTTCIVIREPPVERKSKGKEKEKVDVAYGKGIELLSKVALRKSSAGRSEKEVIMGTFTSHILVVLIATTKEASDEDFWKENENDDVERDWKRPIRLEVDINKKTENQAKMTKLSIEWKRLCKIKAKVQKCQSQSQYRRISSQTGAGTEEYYWMQS